MADYDIGEQHMKIRQGCGLTATNLWKDTVNHLNNPQANPPVDSRVVDLHNTSICVTQYGFPKVDVDAIKRVHSM